jgi:hypothetical protein
MNCPIGLLMIITGDATIRLSGAKVFRAAAFRGAVGPKPEQSLIGFRLNPSAEIGQPIKIQPVDCPKTGI